MKTYRDFIIWQKAMDLVTDVYLKTNGFPKEEQYGLLSQIRRSAVSVSSNFAEGFGRKGNNEFIRFLRIAVGSLYECQTQLEIVKNIGFLNEDDFAILYEKSKEIEAMIRGLERKLEQ